MRSLDTSPVFSFSFSFVETNIPASFPTTSWRTTRDGCRFGDAVCTISSRSAAVRKFDTLNSFGRSVALVIFITRPWQLTNRALCECGHGHSTNAQCLGRDGNCLKSLGFPLFSFNSSRTSAARNDWFGHAPGRREMINSSDSPNDFPHSIIRCAHATVTLREMPNAQCTSALPPVVFASVKNACTAPKCISIFAESVSSILTCRYWNGRGPSSAPAFPTSHGWGTRCIETTCVTPISTRTGRRSSATDSCAPTNNHGVMAVASGISTSDAISRRARHTLAEFEESLFVKSFCVEKETSKSARGDDRSVFHIDNDS